MKKAEFLILSFILIGAFTLRLYKFHNPVADWHSWRQADTSAVSRNFIKNGFDVLYPRYDDVSKIQTGAFNPEGYRFVEFPLYNVFQAGGFRLFNFFSLEEWGRLVTILSSLLSILFIFLIVKKYADPQAALLAAFFYAFIPYNIYYGRVILPDTMMATATLGGIWFFDKWISFDVIMSKAKDLREDSSAFSLRMTVYFLLTVLFTSSALLLKPFAIFFLLPMVVIVWNAYGFSLGKKWQLWMFVALSVLPLVAWRFWMRQYPEGIPSSAWLFNGNHIRFRPSFFYWIGYERFLKLILGYFGFPIVFAGFMATLKNKKSELFFLSFVVASVVYVSVMATGNVQHDYYQISIIPGIAIFMGLGSAFLLRWPKQFNKYIRYGFLSLCTFLSIFFSWNQVKDYFNINNFAIVKAGKLADNILPKDAWVIAPYEGDTSFLYQTNRKGWPVITRRIEEMIASGASYMVIANPTENDLSGFGKQFKVVALSSSYLILKLK